MKTIAISGKGGTGKTTLAALVIRWLSEHSCGPILAVDADANVNLNDLLDVKLKGTIGAIREEMRASVHNLPGGMTKQQFLEYKIQSSIAETPHFDLLAMGRPEGPGCYCYANNLLRDVLNALNANYAFSVIDNEAGMEHLSRRTVQKLDCLLIVSDPTVRGIRAAGKISRLLLELESRVQNKYLILNRIKNVIPEEVQAAVREEKLDLLHSIPEDDMLLAWDQQGKPIWNIPADSAACMAVDCFMKTLILEKETNHEH